MESKKEIVKVMHVIPFVCGGGVERRRFILAKGLSKLKFEQKVVCFNSVPFSKELITNEGVEVIDLNRGAHILNLRTIRGLYREIKKYNPDIVHCSVFEGVVLGGIAAILAKKNKIIFEETSDLYGTSRSFLMRLLIRFLSSWSSAYIAVSNSVAKNLILVQGIPKRLVRVIYNPASEVEKPSEGEIKLKKEMLGIPKDAFIIGCVGRFHNNHKRFTDVIDAISILSGEINNIYLVIFGAGPDLDMLKEHVKNIGVSDRVVFAGYKIDIESWYYIMDIFVVSSAFEAFGLVLAEAMFVSLPVIATAVGGIPEIVVDQVTGFLVAPFKPDEIAEKIRYLYANPELRKNMGISGKQRILERFSGSLYLKNIEELYNEILVKKNKVCHGQ